MALSLSVDDDRTSFFRISEIALFSLSVLALAFRTSFRICGEIVLLFGALGRLVLLCFRFVSCCVDVFGFPRGVGVLLALSLR